MPPRHSPGFFPFLVGSLTFLSLRLSSSLKVVGDSLYFLDFTRCIVIYMADLSAHPEDPFFLGKKNHDLHFKVPKEGINKEDTHKKYMKNYALLFSKLREKESQWKKHNRNFDIHSQGCQAGSMRQRLSGDLAVATKVPTLLSTPSKEDKLVSLCVIEVTALVTNPIISSRSLFS